MMDLGDLLGMDMGPPAQSNNNVMDLAGLDLGGQQPQ
jgi:hypothetical protein